ncbi:MAG TPA: hypothetical protein VL688_12585 [Verrucomicrobiae bacterium]|nr:hypothetical protein [Verrucomicrobiae bacterium]
MKKLILITAAVFLAGCTSGDNNLYKEEQRQELTRQADIIVSAVYMKIFKAEKSQQIDVIEGRKGFTHQIEKGVVFKTKQVLKGQYEKRQFAIGVEIPKMAFGISPDEYPGQKKYTFYMILDKENNKERLIGAEWETPKYTVTKS